MPELPDAPEVADAIKAVAFITGLPIERVSGYVVVAISPEGERLVISNMCCRPHVNATLADVVADTAMEIAARAVHAGPV